MITFTVPTAPPTARTLHGWLTQASKLPAGGQRQAPQRRGYRSATGAFLGASVTPAAERVVLAMSGIPLSDLGVMRELVSALGGGSVSFSIDSPLTGRNDFTAWAEGEIGSPQLRLGNQFDWDLNLRVAV